MTKGKVETEFTCAIEFKMGRIYNCALLCNVTVASKIAFSLSRAKFDRFKNNLELKINCV